VVDCEYAPPRRERPTGSPGGALGLTWLPSRVVYAVSTEASIGRRVAAMAATELGDRRPQSGGHWLRTLRGFDGLKVWWAPTDASQEYEDAFLGAFAASVPAAERAALHDPAILLPFATLRRPTGERKQTGLTGSLIAEPVTAPPPPTRVVTVPDGDAEGARGEPPEPRRRSATPARPRTTRPTVSSAASAATPVAPAAPVAATAADAALTAEGAAGAARLRAELEELTTVKRPAVIARIRTAKEHGDLKENAEYHAAREEQSFLEGRVQALEARLRTAVIVDAPTAGSRVGLGSVVTVEEGGTTATWTIVGADESNPSAGRISSASPVGRALVGRNTDDEIEVSTPAGARHYRIVSIT
jgi:transcription elongation factor GreA